MAGIGLYGVYYAKATVTGGAVTAYGEMSMMGKAISAEFEPNNPDENNLYANNAIAETDASGASGGTLTLTLDRLTNEVAADLYGITTEEVNVTVSEKPVQGTKIARTGNEVSAPVGVAFIKWNQEDNNREHYQAVIYRRVTFAMPTESAETLGESIEWQTPEIEGTVVGKEGDGTKAWYECVEFPSQEAAIQYITNYFADTEQE